MTDSSLPDGNNVYGIIVSASGLRPVLNAVQRFVGNDNAYIYVSGYNGVSTLYCSTEKCDFESTPLDDRFQYLLNGSVAGSVEDVTGFVKELSRCLSDAKIKHSFEIYDESENLAFEISN
jgi:hypothetical protein